MVERTIKFNPIPLIITYCKSLHKVNVEPLQNQQKNLLLYLIDHNVKTFSKTKSHTMIAKSTKK